MDRKTLTRALLLYSARIIYGGALLAASILIARLYGPHGLGLYALLLTLTNLGGILGVFGLNTVVIERLPQLRAREDAPESVPRYLRSALAWVTVTGVAAAVLTGAVAWFLVPALAWSSVTVLFISWGTLFTALLMSKHRQLVAAALDSVARPTLFIVIIAVVGVALSRGLGTTINLALCLSLGVITSIAGTIYLREAEVIFHRPGNTTALPRPHRNAETRSGTASGQASARDHLAHGAVYAITALTTAAAQQLDRFVLELRATTEAVGIYSSTQNVMNIVTYAMLALMSLLLPAIAEWQAGSLDQQAFVRRCRLVSRALTLLAVAVVVVFGLAGDLVLSIFGQEFVRGRWALVILAGGTALAAALGVATTVLSIGRDRLIGLWINVGTVVVNLVLCLFLIPTWGIEGAASATALAQVANRLAGHIILLRRSRVSLTAW